MELCKTKVYGYEHFNQGTFMKMNWGVYGYHKKKEFMKSKKMVYVKKDTVPFLCFFNNTRKFLFVLNCS